MSATGVQQEAGAADVDLFDPAGIALSGDLGGEVEAASGRA